MPRGSCTPPPCMAGYSSFAPPCMVAGLNGLVLKIFFKPDQIWNMFQILAKNKKNSHLSTLLCSSPFEFACMVNGCTKACLGHCITCVGPGPLGSLKNLPALLMGARRLRFCVWFLSFFEAYCAITLPHALVFFTKENNRGLRTWRDHRARPKKIIWKLLFSITADGGGNGKEPSCVLRRRSR